MVINMQVIALLTVLALIMHQVEDAVGIPSQNDQRITSASIVPQSVQPTTSYQSGSLANTTDYNIGVNINNTNHTPSGASVTIQNASIETTTLSTPVATDEKETTTKGWTSTTPSIPIATHEQTTIPLSTHTAPSTSIGTSANLLTSDYTTPTQRPISTTDPPAVKKSCDSKDCFDDPSIVCYGQFTFGEERLANGKKINTRKVRKSATDIEIGRGYKLGDKTKEQVKQDLKEAGVSDDIAEKISKCAGKKTKVEIDKCITDHKLKDIEISARQQRNLFEKQYKASKEQAERQVNIYNKAKWEDLDCKLKGILIDMVFSDDFQPAGASNVQNILRNGIQNNDPRLVLQALQTVQEWTTEQRRRNGKRLRYMTDHTIVCRGQFLFDNPSVYNGKSVTVRRSVQTEGLVIGRGYELVDRTKEEITKDLKEAGVDDVTAQHIANGAGKKGKEANKIVKELKGKKLTKEQQRKLFDIMFKKFEKEAKKKIEKALGINWDDLDCRIQQLVAEMLAHGDLDLDSNDANQKKFREAIKKNDYKAFRDIILATPLWENINLLNMKNIWRHLIRFAKRLQLIKKFDNPLLVCKGQVTFDSEGKDNPKGRFYSRKFHVPGAWSGLTIGRGYDMKFKKKQQVIDDLMNIGIDKKTATKIAGAVGKKGKAAKKYIKDNNLEDFEITREQQRKLFVDVTYPAEEKEAKRLTEKFFKVKWDDLDCKIQEMLTDLKYRGDFLPRSQKEGQKKLREAVEANDVKKFKDVIKNREYWKNVPKDRFNRRVKFMENC